VAKDRARPFSRKHRKYWIPVTGGMALIGFINVAIGFCTYTKPSDVHERIMPDVTYVGSASAGSAARAATNCDPALTTRVQADLPGGVLIACAADRATVMRNDHQIDLELTGAEIRSVAEHLTLPEIPRDVMKSFAVTYPRTIPASAVKRTRRGEPAVYELGFPPGAPHRVATLREDGSVVDLR
jgi:hypothetical protein